MEYDPKIKCVVVMGKFQLPFHTSHEKLILLAKERADEQHVPLYIFTSPKSDARTAERFGKLGMTIGDKKKFFHSLFGVPEENVMGMGVMLTDGKAETCYAWLDEIKSMLQSKGVEPQEAEVVTSIKDGDRKDYFKDGVFRHFSDLLSENLGVHVVDHSAKFDNLETLSSSLLRQRPELNLTESSPGPYAVMALKENNLPWDAALAAITKGTPPSIDPTYLRQNVGAIVGRLQHAAEAQATVTLPDSLDLSMDPGHFVTMLANSTSESHQQHT